MKGKNALRLQATAERIGKTPSEVAGITCAYCAYCFDEALIARSVARENREIERRQAEQEIAQHGARMRS